MPLTSPLLLARLMLGASLLVAPGALAQEAAPLPFGAPSVPAESPTAPNVAAKAEAVTAWLPARPAPQDPGSPAAGTPANASEPNLSALRFYAGQNDLARVAAEIRLLRAKFPGWEPPPDLFTEARGGESEQPFWDLFGKHDLAGLKAAIAQKQHEAPGWQPSTDLSGKLAVAEAYDALVAASDRKDYGAVIDIASSIRALMSCATIDAVWRTAEALALTDDEAHALEAYRFILSTCPTPGERLATIQKASLLIKSPEAMDTLIGMGRRLPNGAGEFAEMRLDRLRQRIGDAAAGRTADQPSAADLDKMAARARQPGGGRDAELLGWYALSRKDYPGAESWFRAAMQPAPSAKAAEGLVLALRDGGKLSEAVEIASRYADLGPLNRKLMMEVLVADLAEAKQPPSAERLAAIGKAIDAEKSADAAQAFGWSRFKAEDVVGATSWFRKSLEWQPNEPAAIGLMLAAKRQKRGSDYAAVVDKYRTTYPRVAELEKLMKGADHPVRQARRSAGHVGSPHRGGGKGEGWDNDATAIVQTFQSGNLDGALAMMDARRGTRPEPKGLAVVRGWALYKKGDWEGARQVFNDVGRRGMQDEADKGLRQIEYGYTNPRFR